MLRIITYEMHLFQSINWKLGSLYLVYDEKNQLSISNNPNLQ